MDSCTLFERRVFGTLTAMRLSSMSKHELPTTRTGSRSVSPSTTLSDASALSPVSSASMFTSIRTLNVRTRATGTSERLHFYVARSLSLVASRLAPHATSGFSFVWFGKRTSLVVWSWSAGACGVVEAAIGIYIYINISI